MDLKKLDSHLKEKIPSADVSLLEALTEYDKKISLDQFNQKAHYQGNRVQTLWELKGMAWPSQSPEPLAFTYLLTKSDDPARTMTAWNWNTR